MQLSEEFDMLFSTKTGYEALDMRITMTFAKKESLLLVLTFPFLPLHLPRRPSVYYSRTGAGEGATSVLAL
jgi:hypothetical protein